MLGAALFGLALVARLIGLTLVGSREIAGNGVDPTTVSAALLALAAVAWSISTVRGLRVA